MERKVITVLGPVSAGEMGLTDAHNHLWISPKGDRVAGQPVLDRAAPILEELIAYRTAGGGAQIDCQPAGAGRDGRQLRWLAQRSDVHVVACTGFHLRQYYPKEAELWSMDRQAAADFFLSEIRQGLVETRASDNPVLPGFIKIAVLESLARSPREMIEAAVIASLRSGYAIEMHTEKGGDIEAYLKFFEKLDYPLTKLVICHIDKRPDVRLHQELAQAGCLLEYDTFFRPKYAPEENVWQLLPAMVEAGYASAIALATDLADQSLWATMGNGPGLTGFVQGIKQRLSTMFDDQKVVDRLMGANIADRLALPNEGKHA